MDFTWLVPIAISIGGAIGGAMYARRRGLPNIQAEVDLATSRLISALKDELELANKALAILRPELAAAQSRIENLEHEVDRLERRTVKLNMRIIELEKANGA